MVVIPRITKVCPSVTYIYYRMKDLRETVINSTGSKGPFVFDFIYKVSTLVFTLLSFVLSLCPFSLFPLRNNLTSVEDTLSMDHQPSIYYIDLSGLYK